MKNVVTNLYPEYLRYIDAYRGIPWKNDALKPVERRLLLAVHQVAKDKLTKSAKVVGHCFVAGTLVSTPTGLVSIENIQVGDEVYTSNGVKFVTNTFVSANTDKLLKITMENGITVTVTKDQPFKVLNENLELEWVNAKDLQDKFILSRGFDIETFENDEAFLIGAFLANGSLDYSQQTQAIMDFSGSENMMNHISALVTKLFNYKGISRVIVDNTFGFRIAKGDICKYLIDKYRLNNKKADNIQIPSEILKHKETWIPFLNGFLNCDASFSKGKYKLRIHSLSKEFIYQLQTLLLHIGVFTRLSSEKKDIKPCYTLHVVANDFDKLLSKLNIFSNSKTKNIIEFDNLRKSNTQIIPHIHSYIYNEIQNSHIGSGNYRLANGSLIKLGIKFLHLNTQFKIFKLKEVFYHDWIYNTNLIDALDSIGSKYYQHLKFIKENNLRFIQVKSIEEIDWEETYDIEVEEDHELIANGLVAHNCIATTHPHGDLSTYESLVGLVNRGFVEGLGNFGAFGLEDMGPAAQRYTEVRANKFLDGLFGEYLDFAPWQELELDSEPLYLPCPIPIGLVGEGMILGIGNNVTRIPRYSFPDLIKRTVEIITGSSTRTTIAPNIANCAIYEETPGEFEKILTQGEGVIQCVPRQQTVNNSIVVYGRNPINGFTSLKSTNIKYEQDNGHPLYTLVDLSKDKLMIQVTPYRGKVDADFELMIAKLLSTRIKVKCNFVDEDFAVRKFPIDDILLAAYTNWKNCYAGSLQTDLKKLNQKLQDYKILQLARGIYQQNPTARTITDICNIYAANPQPGFDAEDINRVCSSYSFKKVIEAEIDIPKIQTQINDKQAEINNVDQTASNRLTTLI